MCIIVYIYLSTVSMSQECSAILFPTQAVQVLKTCAAGAWPVASRLIHVMTQSAMQPNQICLTSASNTFKVGSGTWRGIVQQQQSQYMMLQHKMNHFWGDLRRCKKVMVKLEQLEASRF